MVRTLAFHASNTGSNPVGDAINIIRVCILSIRYMRRRHRALRVRPGDLRRLYAGKTVQKAQDGNAQTGKTNQANT